MALLLAGFAVLTLGVGGFGPASATAGTTDIGTAHPLADDAAISEYQRTGYTSGEMDRYRITLTMSSERGAVGLQPSIVSNVRNDYLKISYQEDHARTLRFLIPREYATPYVRESVESVSSDHVASFGPAREGKFLEVIVEVDGPAEIVLPVEKGSEIAYGYMERVDKRVEEATGVSPLGRDAEWQYVDEERLETEAAIAIDADPKNTLIQFDAKPNQAEEVWLNAPQGERNGVEAYYFVKESEDQIYIVVTGENPPAVRYKTDATMTDKATGWVNDAKQMPSRLKDLGWSLFGDDSEDG